MRRPGREDPHRRKRKFVRILLTNLQQCLEKSEKSVKLKLHFSGNYFLIHFEAIFGDFNTENQIGEDKIYNIDFIH